jgi:hypothetical protein
MPNPEEKQPRPATYRIQLPAIGLASRGGHWAAVKIPEGTVLSVIGPSEKPRFLVVEMDGQQVWLFETDLQDRCALIAPDAKRAATMAANAG